MRTIEKTVSYIWIHEVWNQSQRSSIAKLLTEDVVAHGLSEGDMIGIDGFQKYYDDFQRDFENVDIVVEDVISEDDMESMRCTMAATHKESKQRVSFTGQCMSKIRDGKIAEAWNNFGFFTMYQQLGYSLSPK